MELTIKTLLPNIDNNTLTLLINLAKDFAINYCNLSAYEDKLDNTIIMMVIEDFSKLGVEGISSRSTNGISESYLTDYSSKIYSALNGFKINKQPNIINMW